MTERIRKHESAPRFTLGILVLVASFSWGCASTAQQARRDRLELERERSTAELIRKGEASSAVGDMTRARAVLRRGAARRDARAAASCRGCCWCASPISVIRSPLSMPSDYLRRHPRRSDVPSPPRPCTPRSATTRHERAHSSKRSIATAPGVAGSRTTRWPACCGEDNDAGALALADTQDLAVFAARTTRSARRDGAARLSRERHDSETSLRGDAAPVLRAHRPVPRRSGGQRQS